MTNSSALTLAPANPLSLAGFNTPLSLGNLDAYIQAVQRLPMLSAEEEHDLANRFHKEQDLEAARQLVMSHLRLVVSIARQYMGYGLPQADLIQEGNIGLMKAVKRFNPEQGVRLVSYALHWIKAEIHEYIVRNWRMVKIATTKAQRKLFFNLRSLKSNYNGLSGEEIEAVAKTLDVKPSDVVEMDTRLSGADIALDGQDDDEYNVAPITYLTDVRHEPSAVLARAQQDRLYGEGLEHALAQLDARSRRIVEARWLNVNDDGSGGTTLHDLAAEFGVSAERIRQIETAAMKKMRHVLQTFK
jgi:RNA polymerase sigma-32 factor